MATKLSAAKIATAAGADMLIANGDDFHVIHRIMQGAEIGTLFKGRQDEEFHLIDILDEK
jgi:glutamate 5-kinase